MPEALNAIAQTITPIIVEVMEATRRATPLYLGPKTNAELAITGNDQMPSRKYISPPPSQECFAPTENATNM